ncbi:hypothetical protein Fmac_012219 [Flemingia macrophylla]|uniref:Uncharacterized protein n=1 Tax=Flemingia macrophylla TaxID=520843 RepID=A0ABD1MQI6_9FABA
MTSAPGLRPGPGSRASRWGDPQMRSSSRKQPSTIIILARSLGLNRTSSTL